MTGVWILTLVLAAPLAMLACRWVLSVLRPAHLEANRASCALISLIPMACALFLAFSVSPWLDPWVGLALVPLAAALVLRLGFKERWLAAIPLGVVVLVAWTLATAVTWVSGWTIHGAVVHSPILCALAAAATVVGLRARQVMEASRARTINEVTSWLYR